MGCSGQEMGATVVKGGQILRRAQRNLGTRSLSYLLACLLRGMCARQGGAQGYTGLPTQFSFQIPSNFLSLPLAPSASKLFSLPACVLTSLPLMASFTLPCLPPDLAVPSTTAVPEGGISAPGRLIHPAAHPGGHVALLLSLCSPPSVAAGLSDRGEACVLYLPDFLGAHSPPPSPLETPVLGGVHTDIRARSCSLQLTFVTGEKSTEIFIQSLELGHSAATRAIKASGGHRGTPWRDG